LVSVDYVVPTADFDIDVGADVAAGSDKLAGCYDYYEKECH
jgi:hypothetical protein